MTKTNYSFSQGQITQYAQMLCCDGYLSVFICFSVNFKNVHVRLLCLTTCLCLILLYTHNNLCAQDNSFVHEVIWRFETLGGSVILVCFCFLPAGMCPALTAWLRPCRQAPASSTTTTPIPWRCPSAATRCQVHLPIQVQLNSEQHLYTMSFVKKKHLVSPYQLFICFVCPQALVGSSARWRLSTTPSWRLWWLRWEMYKAFSNRRWLHMTYDPPMMCLNLISMWYAAKRWE